MAKKSHDTKLFTAESYIPEIKSSSIQWYLVYGLQLINKANIPFCMIAFERISPAVLMTFASALLKGRNNKDKQYLLLIFITLL